MSNPTQSSTQKIQSEDLPASTTQDDFLPTMRELVSTYQAFAVYSESHVRSLGFTPPQFDVIATLGGTTGMMMGDLAEKTLVTKGTMTGIVDRLEEKGLVQREVPQDNRRCCYISLTAAGEQVFAEVFPVHMAHLQQKFDRLNSLEQEHLRSLLQKLRQVF